MSNEDRPRGRGRSGYDEPSTSSGAKRPRNESSNGSNGNGTGKRQAQEKRGGSSRRREIFQIIHTRPKDLVETSHSGGNRVTIEANYSRLISHLPSNRKWTIYKYHVTFDPECLAKRVQSFLVGQHRDAIGGYLFDGAQLFAVRKLHEDESGHVEFQTKTRDDTTYIIRVQFTKIVLMSEQESLQVLNLILRRNMKGLNLTLVGRNFYNPAAMINLSNFRLQLWPGYETSIRNHQIGILMNCDVAHKVMQTDTVLDLLMRCRREDERGFENTFKQKVLGITVLTNYNNKTYRIDDVDFNITPASTFMKHNVETTIQRYYKEKHKLEIRNPTQPLLISNPRAQELRGGERNPVWLVPELCLITGLDEQQRTNMDLKMALRPYSQMQPHTRRQRLMEFSNRIRGSEENAKIRAEFGLEMERDLVQLDAHVIDGEKLFFGGDTELNLGGPEHRSGKASWGRECGRRPYGMLKTDGCSRWLVICPQQMEREMKQLVQKMQDYGRAMNFEMREPKWFLTRNDQQIVPEIDQRAQLNPNIILIGTTKNNKRNSELYSSIKKKCFSDHAVACQVVTKFILQQRNRFDSVATKLAIQMCVKLGGAPWRGRCPLKNAMTIGFDVAKDSANRNVSYGCLVATMNLRERSTYFSAVSRIEGVDCTNELVLNVIKAINKYAETEGELPSYIILYRGGVSDGELGYVHDIELAQLNTAIAKRYQGAPPKLAYILVSKRVNTRFWQRTNGNNVSNPEPGTVIENTVTLQERYEFFLLSQKSGQGTASPTNYNIIYDTTELEPIKIQTWTFIHTHLYYNWCGTTRIPAVLQYANKLGFLISNYMHRIPQTSLEDRLYFLATHWHLYADKEIEYQMFVSG